MSDELLSHLSDRFLKTGMIRSYTGASFIDYLQMPAYYDEITFHMKCGGGFVVQGDKLILTGGSQSVH